MFNCIHSSNVGKINKIYDKQKVEKASVSQQNEKTESNSLASFNNAYVTPFINVRNVQKSKYTKNELDFINYRDKFCEVLNKVTAEYCKAQWEFYNNCSTENANTLNILASTLDTPFQDKEAYKKFQEFNEKGLKDEHLKKHMDYILSEFENNLEVGEYKENQTNTTSNSDDLKTDVMKILNSPFEFKMDGKPVSYDYISSILATEKNDISIRRKAYSASFQDGDAAAAKIIELVKQRNETARSEGYKNYFVQKIEQYGINEEKLSKLLDDLNEKADPIYRKVKQKEDAVICKNFGISPEQIEPHHYGYLTEESDKISDKINKYFKAEEMLSSATKLYGNMGWKIDKMSFEMDLYPRENKDNGGSCHKIEAGKDIRIMANLTDDESSMKTLLHELGHAVYYMGFDKSLPYFDKDCASNALTESVAMLMGSLPAREGTYKSLVGMPEKLNNDCINMQIGELSRYLKSYIFICQFEKQLYENPEQDIPKLWYDLKEKYMGYKSPSGEQPNEWALRRHFVTHPGYYTNYVKGLCMTEQIYDAAHEKLGGNLSENKETAKFFEENIFKYGSTKTEEEILKIVSGKELTADALCKRLDKAKVL